MKLLKNIVSDFFSTVTTNTVPSSSIPALIRSESFLFTAFHDIKNNLVQYSKGLLSKNVLLKTKPVTIPIAINFPDIATIPLIKASTIVINNNKQFSGHSVLCVGGQMQLYPAYQQIVEDEGGRFLSYHGGAEDPITDLCRLLDHTDMVICPIDCIRHEAFFITRHYCQQSHKPCVMLDKSRITTFYNGIQMLKNFSRASRMSFTSNSSQTP